MKYLRQFNSEVEYLDFKEAPDYITPNVSFIIDSETVMYNEYVEPPISLCDIAYWDGSSVKTVSKDKWNSSLGTANWCLWLFLRECYPMVRQE